MPSIDSLSGEPIEPSLAMAAASRLLAKRRHLAGVEAFQAGQDGRAAELIADAIRLNPDEGDYYADFGLVLQRLGDLEGAEAGFRAAIHLRPTGPAPYNSLGMLLRERGLLGQAEAMLLQALRLRPGFVQAHNNLGCVQRDLGRIREARVSFEMARTLRPTFAEVHNNLGNVLKELGLRELAAESFAEAVAMQPDFLEAHVGLGGVLCELDREQDALACFSRALAIDPHSAPLHNNRAFALQRLGRHAEAAQAYREALRLDPDHVDARANLGMVLLLLGQYEEGWRAHEGRWRSRHMQIGRRQFDQPMWHWRAGGQTVLIHAEQGLGDTLQFCRYVPLLAAHQRIVFEVPPPLVGLMRRLPGGAQVVARGEDLPAFDAHCPLMSLPLLFGTTLDTIPSPTRYLAADTVKASAWAERLRDAQGLRCGLVWAGGSRPDQPEVDAMDRRRSLTLDQLAPLADAPGVAFVSLQKGPAGAQAREVAGGFSLIDHTNDLHDFDDTAALVQALDLVISVDTSVAHLAAGLGKPVWLLNRHDTCWRWLLDRDDSPWYGSLRLFRQDQPGDWTAPLTAVRRALAFLAADVPVGQGLGAGVSVAPSATGAMP